MAPSSRPSRSDHHDDARELSSKAAQTDWEFPKFRTELRNDRPRRPRIANVVYGDDGSASRTEYSDPGALRQALAERRDQRSSEVRLAICEDVSPDLMATLGNCYNVDPEFFQAHMDASVSRFSKLFPNPPLPVSENLESSAHLTLHYPRARYFATPADFAEAKREMEQFTIMRPMLGDKVWQPTDWLNSESQVSIILAKTSLWVDKLDNGAITGILLLDSTLESGSELRADYQPFTSSSGKLHRANIETSQERAQTGSLFEHIVDVCSSFGAEDLSRIHRDPRCIAMPMYHQVIADWFQVLNWLMGVLSALEWQFEKPSWGEKPDDLSIVLRQLLPWRRTASDCLSMIDDNIANLFPSTTLKSHQKQSDIFELWTDFRTLRQQANEVNARIGSIESVIFNTIALQESRSSLRQARQVQWLTYLAFLFVPASFAASFFGMSIGEPENSKVFTSIIIATSIPLALSGLVAYIWHFQERS
ncbi:hypothetical protein CKM354_000755800 [Cercospora kikuchii]|uniref:Uncharacterized protein n=1 Tax=Cercospora kikuchii TaxID=84275 RepID=A0A9P3FEF8_9PEZI|nr:uncharacterized protein CKM354_000755800 [Cercospora kikuchii]GIZ44358.1 hypothetical protein CKM354_000755800 [Cercospora kikuchii]